MFHAKSTALEVVQGLKADLTGKVVLITGGTAGEFLSSLLKRKRERLFSLQDLASRLHVPWLPLMLM